MSTEFRVYLLIVIGTTLWAYVTSGTGDGTSAGFRDSMFTMTSTITTTGYVD